MDVSFEQLKGIIADQQIEIRLLREANAILGKRVAEAEQADEATQAEPIPMNREQRRSARKVKGV